LHVAAALGLQNEAKYLLLQDADIEAENKERQTPLSVAIWSEKTMLVKFLLSHGADRTAATYGGSTSLHQACTLQSVEIVAILLATTKYIQLEAFLSRRDDIGRTALAIACQNGNSAIVKLLLGEGADPMTASDHGTLLHLACSAQAEDVVEALLQWTSNVSHAKFLDQRDISGRTALACACQDGNLGIITLLLRKGADPTIATMSDSTPLHLACLAQAQWVVAALINSTSELRPKEFLDRRDNRGRTALEYAFQNGDLEILRLLLRAGADPNAEWHYDIDNNTSPSNFQEEMIGLMQKHGGALSFETRSGFNQLCTAAMCGNLQICQILINAGADIDCEEYGQTALYLAARNGHIDIVHYLIGRGAAREAPSIIPSGEWRYVYMESHVAISLQKEIKSVLLAHEGGKSSPEVEMPGEAPARTKRKWFRRRRKDGKSN
jgi:serine/threonine-protein phosphatase 6 regulatory ankyrin repeat subunit B